MLVTLGGLVQEVAAGATIETRGNFWIGFSVAEMTGAPLTPTVTGGDCELAHGDLQFARAVEGEICQITVATENGPVAFSLRLDRVVYELHLDEFPSEGCVTAGEILAPLTIRVTNGHHTGVLLNATWLVENATIGDSGLHVHDVAGSDNIVRLTLRVDPEPDAAATGTVVLSYDASGAYLWTDPEPITLHFDISSDC